MKKRYWLGLTLLMAGWLPAAAQVAYINPVPQSVSVGADGCFDVPARWNLVSTAPDYVNSVLNRLATLTPRPVSRWW